MPTTYAIPNGATVFDVRTWPDAGTTQPYVAVGASGKASAVSFAPDLAWVKCVGTNGTDHILQNTVQGAGTGQALYSNATSAAGTQDAYGYVSTFGSNGISLSSTGGGGDIGISNRSMVAWLWNAGSGTTSSNTSGSITSTVSVNATAGFSIVTYTGNNSTATIGHGLGVAPSMIIIKDRLQGTGYNWNVYHASIGNTQRVFLDSTSNAIAGVWNNTSPTSTVFTVTNNVAVNGTDTYVAYCWAAVPGFSAFGSYTGNGSADGPFVYLGFRPRWLMIKESTPNARNWMIFDAVRSPYNQVGLHIMPNSSDAEGTGSGIYNQLDFLSNGIKFRAGTNSEPTNESGATYIYAAFAENPFKYANAR